MSNPVAYVKVTFQNGEVVAMDMIEYCTLTSRDRVKWVQLVGTEIKPAFDAVGEAA